MRKRLPATLVAAALLLATLAAPGVAAAAPLSENAAMPAAQAAQTTWFFAEGSTQPPFDTWFLIQNPTAQTATVRFTFFLQPSGTVTRTFSVGPTSRFSIFANQLIPNVAFSTRVDSSVPVFVERSMFVSFDGTIVLGVPAPNRVWLFAEGATVQPFQTWLLLQNPNPVPAPTTITYMLDTGQNVIQTLTLPPNSRSSIFVNQVLPNAAFSSRVESEQPIVVERSLFRFPGNAAIAKAGANAASRTWFFAEGRTSFRGLRADTFLLLDNPTGTTANATITLFGTDGQQRSFTVPIPAMTRRTIFLNPFFSGAFGIRVVADNEVIAERSVFFGNAPLLGAYSTRGATALSTGWNLAEGETRAPFDEQISILNPQGQAMSVRVDFQLADGQVITRTFAVAPNSKLDIGVDTIIPGANSARITTSLPSVVERTMFIFKAGSIGATNTIGFANP